MIPKRKLIVLAPIGILAILIFATIGGTVVRLLWNWLLPPLFGWREITFWQALGLLALCRILFGGVGLHGSGRSSIRHRMADRMADRITERMGERWDQMTPEERERFRERIRDRFGVGPSASGNEAQ